MYLNNTLICARRCTNTNTHPHMMNVKNKTRNQLLLDDTKKSEIV